MVFVLTTILIPNPNFNQKLAPASLFIRTTLTTLQPWITPSLFDDTGDDRIVDEYTFGQYQSYSTALAALQTHWDTVRLSMSLISVLDLG